MLTTTFDKNILRLGHLRQTVTYWSEDHESVADTDNTDITDQVTDDAASERMKMFQHYYVVTTDCEETQCDHKDTKQQQYCVMHLR